MPRGARRPDFAGHVKAQLRTLKSRLDRRNIVIDTVRDVNATLDPQKVANWLVRQADEWIAAPCWAVVAPDLGGQLAVLADKGLSPALGPSVTGVAQWVSDQGVELMAADLARDRRLHGEDSVIGTARRARHASPLRRRPAQGWGPEPQTMEPWRLPGRGGGRSWTRRGR